MKEILERVPGFLSSVPPVIPVAAALILLLPAGLIFYLSRLRLIRKAASLMDQGVRDEAVRSRLLAKPALLEALVRKKGENVIPFFDAADCLLRRLEEKNRPEDASRVLNLIPEKGLFSVLMSAAAARDAAAVLSGYLKEHQDILVLRKMAASAGGRSFSGTSVHGILEPYLKEIRELSGDPEWVVRHFALQILLVCDDTSSRRLVDEAFTDPHPLIRRIVAAEGGRDNPAELFGQLMTMVLDDPIPEVRRAARSRIDAEFPHRWKLNPSGMNPLQSIHVMELLNIGSREDENAALNALGGDDLEARLVAARFLEKSGTLSRFLSEADRGDRDDWKRRLHLLSQAVSVGITQFLKVLDGASSTDVLLLGARLLAEGGDHHLIYAVVRKAFAESDPIRCADDEELYRAAVELACRRGDEQARLLVRDELKRRRTDEAVLGFILPLLPPAEAPVYRSVLLDFLEDPGFPADDAFFTIMAKLPPEMFLAPVLDILEADRSRYGHAVRLRALHCLGAWHLDQTLQTILENLPILPAESCREFSRYLEDMDLQRLKDRAAFILASPDAGIRSALFSCLPASTLPDFSREIRAGLNDADPGVRIASMRAMLDSGDLKATPPALALLRDPVEEVRLEAARIAGLKGSAKFLETLQTIFMDENESPVVRRAAVTGLAAGTTRDSMDILVGFLDTGGPFHEDVVRALASRTDAKSVTALVEHFKDSEALLRCRIAEAFKAMGQEGEDALVALLQDDITSLKPFLADILTQTGFVETQIRKLGHRLPAVRRTAAELLASIATDSAYRGIVLAARDPDRDVRIKVTKALESLASDEGEAVLESLRNDPDRKVRCYTLWAMERLKARKLP